MICPPGVKIKKRWEEKPKPFQWLIFGILFSFLLSPSPKGGSSASRLLSRSSVIPLGNGEGQRLTMKQMTGNCSQKHNAGPPPAHPPSPRDGPPHPSGDAMVPRAPLSSHESKGLFRTAGREGALALWGQPSPASGKEHAIPCNPGGSAGRGSGGSAPRRSPARRRPSEGSRRPGAPRLLLPRGRPAVTGAARKRWHLGCGPRRPPLAAGWVRVCEAGVTSHRRGAG